MNLLQLFQYIPQMVSYLEAYPAAAALSIQNLLSQGGLSDPHLLTGTQPQALPMTSAKAGGRLSLQRLDQGLKGCAMGKLPQQSDVSYVRVLC